MTYKNKLFNYKDKILIFLVLFKNKDKIQHNITWNQIKIEKKYIILKVYYKKLYNHNLGKRNCF